MSLAELFDRARDVAHPLHRAQLDAANGVHPPVDGGVTVVPTWRGGLSAVVCFTGHSYVATDRSADEVLAQSPDGFGGSLGPSFLTWLTGAGTCGVTDMTLVARGRGDDRSGGGLAETDAYDDHSRVRHARAIRDQVHVFGDERGLCTLSLGLGGRLELSVEAAAERQNTGAGRALVHDLLGVVPAGQAVFAAVSPGNVRSLRAFLALGFQPLGSEVIILDRRDPEFS